MTSSLTQPLSDMVESIIGAVYVSDNFSPVGAEAFFDNVLRPFFDEHITLQTLSHHPTKTLFELLQAHGCQSMKISKDPKRDGVVTCHGKWFCSVSQRLSTDTLVALGTIQSHCIKKFWHLGVAQHQAQRRVPHRRRRSR